jgi:MinD-like ATPase involved in chromosome partitioning or flagellar assembly
MATADYQEIIAEYKEQVRVLKEQVNELTDACKAKDAAVKRALQKLEYTTNDLDKANEEMKEKTDETDGKL